MGPAIKLNIIHGLYNTYGSEELGMQWAEEKDERNTP